MMSLSTASKNENDHDCYNNDDKNNNPADTHIHIRLPPRGRWIFRYLCIYIYTHTCIHTFTCTYTYICTCTYTCTYICIMMIIIRRIHTYMLGSHHVGGDTAANEDKLAKLSKIAEMAVAAAARRLYRMCSLTV